MATINVLGYPSSAAAYCVGVEEAPAALREAGLVTALEAAGHLVRDAGDLPVHRWRPDRERPLVQNLDEEVDALRGLADAAHALVAPGERLLVLGGSCTTALGVCAAVEQDDTEVSLIYIDRHLDLNTPASTTDGSLSWMGMAHALGLDGAARELVELAGRRPLLRPDRLSYLGVGLTAETTAWEREQVDELDLTVVSQDELVTDPAQAATGRGRPCRRGPTSCTSTSMSWTSWTLPWQRTSTGATAVPPWPSWVWRSTSCGAIPPASESRSDSSSPPTPPPTPPAGTLRRGPDPTRRQLRRLLEAWNPTSRVLKSQPLGDSEGCSGSGGRRCRGRHCP